MNDIAPKSGSQDIVVDTDFRHPPETIWRMLTTSDLIGRWMMVPTGFEPVEGKRFTFQTTPAGAWDGVIRCQVLEVIPNARLVHSWTGGHEGNAGYGSRLDTVITWTLVATETGTRKRRGSPNPLSETTIVSPPSCRPFAAVGSPCIRTNLLLPRPRRSQRAGPLFMPRSYHY